MALVLADRVKETTSTTGTGALSLGGAETNFASFSSVLSDGDTTYYAIIDDVNADYEVGLGTYASGANTLARTTILSSSNAGSVVNLSSGSKVVFITYPAGKSVIADSTGVVTLANSVLTTTDINGGNVDGTNIGASTPGTGVFTSLETEGAFTEDADAITSSSNAATLDLSAATNFTHDLSENVTYTFSNPAASGKASAFTLKVVQDSTARTITWPASVNWPGGTAPTISAGDGDVDYFVFITTDNGTTYYGFTAGQAFATP